VTSLLLPELFKLLTFCHAEGERTLLNLNGGLAKLSEEVAFDAQLGEGNVATMLVHA